MKEHPTNFVTFPEIYLGTTVVAMSMFVELDVSMEPYLQATFPNFKIVHFSMKTKIVITSSCTEQFNAYSAVDCNEFYCNTYHV